MGRGCFTCIFLLFLAALTDFLLADVSQDDEQHHDTDGESHRHPESHGGEGKVLALGEEKEKSFCSYNAEGYKRQVEFRGYFLITRDKYPLEKRIRSIIGVLLSARPWPTSGACDACWRSLLQAAKRLMLHEGSTFTTQQLPCQLHAN